MDITSDFKIGYAAPWYKRRWWLRSRVIKGAMLIIPGGGLPAIHELYVPWWAWPMEIAHRGIFGTVKLTIIRQGDYSAAESGAMLTFRNTANEVLGKYVKE